MPRLIKLSEQITNKRTSLGMSRAELADKIGVKTTEVWRWEREIANPTLYTLLELAEFFKMSVDELVYGR